MPTDMPMWVSVPKSGDCNLSKGWPYKEAEKEENGRKKRRGSESWLSDAASSSSKLHCQLMLCSMTLRSSGLIAAHRSAMVLLPLPFPLLDPLSMRTRSASKSCIPKISPVGSFTSTSADPAPIVNFAAWVCSPLTVSHTPVKPGVTACSAVFVLQPAKPPPCVLMTPENSRAPEGVSCKLEEDIPPMTMSFRQYHWRGVPPKIFKSGDSNVSSACDCM
mmetsp:Transcript_81779/g.162292  ORF Transcript_81779/g.162292 Transcript_81779/m.162292 type:complete len:219 (+) Transcript_81779:88-744(+)